jgi:hypothetical protein
MGVTGFMTVQALLRQHRVRQGGILIHIGLRVDSTAQIQMTSAHAHTVGTVDPSTIGENMRQRTLGSEFAVTLESSQVCSQVSERRHIVLAEAGGPMPDSTWQDRTLVKYLQGA